MTRLYKLILIVFILTSCTGKEYKKIRGFIFGTTYSITYRAHPNQDYSVDIQKLMLDFDASLSTYNPTSVITKVNNNDSTVILDEYFLYFYKKAKEISVKTEGAFDITIAPLVNAWGFGFTGEKNMDTTRIDSLLTLVGYKKIRLEKGQIIKENPGIMLDGSAIAKGYSVDVIADFLENKEVLNYMVEIGGEVRLKGVNPEGNKWRVGVDKPITDLTEREIFSVINITNTAMATSGNYRQYFIEEGIMYSHTIDPFTGYPAKNKLLSSTVFSKECITADAYATAFMVMGLKKSIQISKNNPELEVYFIYSDNKGNFKEYSSDGIKNLISN